MKPLLRIVQFLEAMSADWALAERGGTYEEHAQATRKRFAENSRNP